MRMSTSIEHAPHGTDAAACRRWMARHSRASFSSGGRLVLLVLALTAAIATGARAQHEYDLWYFGDHYAIDFRSGSPQVASGSSTWQSEGCAVMCDRRTGELRFYTDGVTVWNRDHLPMANGTGLYGHYSSVQSALIVPVPCDTNRFFIFTADQQGYVDAAPMRGINYSIVDMRLAGGLGEVVSKNNLVQGVASERLVAVANSNGFDYWVITHSIAGQTFYAWKVDGSGVSSTPVVSLVGQDHGIPRTGRDSLTLSLTVGCIKSSPNGRKLAMTSYAVNTVELFDFDPATGRVTNPILLYQGPYFNQNGTAYGASFSPDNTKLYHGAMGDLVQYDVSKPTAAEIVGSRTTIIPSDAPGPIVIGSMQIGPDRKIYVVNDAQNIGVINDPNAAGQGCGYVSRLFGFGWSALLVLGLPNNIDAAWTFDTTTSALIDPPGPIRLCAGDSVVLTGAPGFASYRWSNGAMGRTITARMPGQYTLRAFNQFGCFREQVVDVIAVPSPQPSIVADGASVLCDGDSALLHVPGRYAAVRWSTGETDSAVVVRTAGVYSVTVVDSNGCTGVDSMTLRVEPRPDPVIAGAGVLCVGDTAVLDAGPGYTRYLWSTGETTQTIRSDSSMTVSVTVWNSAGCSGTSDTACVVIRKPQTPGIASDSLIVLCEGDTATIIANPGFADYLWSTGDTGLVLRTPSSGTYRVAARDSFGCIGSSMTVRVVVRPRPDAPSITSNGDTLQSTPAWRLQWSYNGDLIPGATGDRLLAVAPGLYTVTAFDSNGCGTASTPYRISRPHRFSFDTVALRVGESGRLTLRSAPPIERREMLTRYRIVFDVDRASVFVQGAFDIDGTPLSFVAREDAGRYEVERMGGGVLEGERVMEVDVHGLSTGTPFNPVTIVSVASVENDSVVAGDNGLILLRGCDIAHGFAFGKRASIRSVAPNPITALATVAYQAPVGSQPVLVLIDPLGREVCRWAGVVGSSEEERASFDLTNVPPGPYRLLIREGVEVSGVSVIVVR